MNQILKALIQGHALSRKDMYRVFAQLSTHPVEQQAAFLALLAMKRESSDELLGALDFMLEQSVRVPLIGDSVDIVGTGGDGLSTFNISTAASLVIASCGVSVAKNGGRSVTSRSGSTDVIEALGIPISDTPEACLKALKTHQYAYMWGSLFNPAFRSFAALRKNLGFPTVFNHLGPLLNPIQPKRQVVGVSSPELLPVMATVLKEKKSTHALIVHAEEGMDEFSVSGPTRVIELRHETLTAYTITPQAVGLAQSALEDVVGGNAEENASIIRGIFDGHITGARLDIVLLNSAAGLLVANKVADLREGVERARNAIQSGQTARFVNQLRTLGGSQ